MFNRFSLMNQSKSGPMLKTLDVNLEHFIFSSSFTSLILTLLMVLLKSLWSMPDIITYWIDFQTSVSATCSKLFNHSQCYWSHISLHIWYNFVMLGFLFSRGCFLLYLLLFLHLQQDFHSICPIYVGNFSIRNQ